MFFKFDQSIVFIVRTKEMRERALDLGGSIKKGTANVNELLSVNMARDLPVKELLDLISRGFSQHLYVFVLIMNR